MYKHNGYYYLFNITWPQGYADLSCIAQKEITGPYEGRVVLRDRVSPRVVLSTPPREIGTPTCFVITGR